MSKDPSSPSSSTGLKRANQILDQLHEIPPPPQIAWKLMDMLKRPTQNNTEVVQIIEYDPVLTSKLLKACNSAFWSRGVPVGSVKAALLKMGYGEVMRIVMALSVKGVLTSENEGYGVEANQIWFHSVVSAIMSQRLAETSSAHMQDPELAFTAGLVHDIGKMALGSTTLASVGDIRNLIETEGLTWIDAESRVIGTNHAEVGACLLARWKFPDAVVEAVANHHAPTLNPPALSTIVHVADCCAHVTGSSYGWNSMASKMESEALTALGLRPEEMDALVVHVHTLSDRINSFIALV
jgi:putative nucleotidyltransferase with HDIG domain